MRLTRIVMGALVLAGTVEAGAQEEGKATRSFEVTASRFQFDPATIEVEEGEQVKITLKSADGTHGFAIKDYKVKVAIPKGGQAVTVEFVADKAGSFEFACSEYCGPGHRDMKGRLVVAPRAK